MVETKENTNQVKGALLPPLCKLNRWPSRNQARFPPNVSISLRLFIFYCAATPCLSQSRCLGMPKNIHLLITTVFVFEFSFEHSLITLCMTWKIMMNCRKAQDLEDAEERKGRKSL